jgi:hypothetical protein
MFFLVIAIFALLALADFPQLVQDKKWKDVALLGGFYAAVLALALSSALGGTLPSPYVGLQDLIANVLHLGYPKP